MYLELLLRQSKIGEQMKNIILFMFFLIFSFSSAFSGTMTGTFKTEVSEETGGYLLIKFSSCEKNKSLSCGIIENAIDKKGKISKKYEHKGKLLVWDMKDDGNGKFSSGKIWDPTKDKIYNSKMELLSKKKLAVSGCIAFFCRAQEWVKAK